VQFTGYVDDRAEIAASYATADISLSVCPAETFGLAVLEAMASGTPVVTADAGGGRELVDSSCAEWGAPDPQSIADAIERMAEIAATELGELQQVRAYGAWLRTVAYFKRSAWAGKRRMNGARVADGVGTNALAHAIATACAIVGLTDIADVERVETELYHAHPTESDDTSWYRIVRRSGVPITAALTLVGPDHDNPTVTLVGTRGRAELQYTTDIITVTVEDEVRQERVDRTDLLENLVDHRQHGTELRVPLERTLGYMAVLEATQDRPDPAQIDDRYLDWVGEGDEAHPVVQDVKHWLTHALDEGAGFAEVGAPWAKPEAAHTWTPR